MIKKIYIPLFTLAISAQNQSSIKWFKLGYDGNALLQNTDSIPGREISFVATDSIRHGEMLTCGYLRKSASDTFGSWVVQKMDTNFNVKWRKVHQSEYTFSGIQNIVSYNNFSLLNGVFWRDSVNGQYPAVHNHVRILKIDTLGNMIWSKAIDSTAWNNALSMIKSHDGNLMICGRSWGYGITDGGAFVMKVDTAGNKLWHQTYNLPLFDGFEKIIATSDGNYVCAGWGGIAPEIQDMPNGVARVVKISPNGTVIWDRLINVSPRSEDFRTVVEANNGDIVAFGGTYLNYAYDQYNYQVGNTGGPDGLAVRLDKNGNEKWRRVFGKNAVEDCQDYIYNAAALPDGSFIATGTTQVPDTGLFPNGLQPYVRQVGWISRLDSNGCVFQACVDTLNIGVKPVDFAGNIKVYPNPATTQLNVTSEKPFDKNTTVTLIDVLGRTVIQPHNIGGLYRYQMPLNAAPGLYTLVFGINGERYYKKVVVK